MTSTEGEWVLRGDSHYPCQFPKERFFARLIQEHTDVPVPWPYLLDTDRTIFGWAYILMPRMPGLQTSDPAVRAALSRQDQLGIAAALGKTLAQLHDFEWAYHGEYEVESDGIVPHPRSWSAHVGAEIQEWPEQARAVTDRTPEEDVAWAHAVVAAGRDALDVPFSASTLLHDYNYNNSVATRGGDAWRITGVFDLMEAAVGDGERDLCRQTAMYLSQAPGLARAFVQAYLRDRGSRPGFAERLSVYLLGERIIVWGYGQRYPELEWWDRRLTFREWAEPFLNAIPTLL